MTDAAQIEQLVEHLFRHQSGRMVATLTRIFGTENLQMAEDVVQETLIKALQQWSFKGVPDNPEAWLMQVAKNRALDVLRRQSTLEKKLPAIAQDQAKIHSLEDSLDEAAFLDDQLTMLFMGCHPALSLEMQVTLLLKTLGGFSVREIAGAFLLSEATIAKRITRAKQGIREQDVPFEMPSSETFGRHLDTVLMLIYLIFSEGYKAGEGDALIRADLCAEAIRLAEMLVQHPLGNLPVVHALLALMYMQASRLMTRTDGERLLLLAEQDRSQWNQEAIQHGLVHLEQSAQGQRMTAYHLQAGIAACHTLAPSYEETDWAQILTYYDQLMQIAPSSFVALNRAVALAEVESVAVALQSATSNREHQLLLSLSRDISRI